MAILSGGRLFVLVETRFKRKMNVGGICPNELDWLQRDLTESGDRLRTAACPMLSFGSQPEGLL